MPVSKKRKRAGKVVQRQVFQGYQPDHSKRWKLKIKPEQFIYLRDDPDFLLLIKIGRAINAISFATCNWISFVECKTHVQRRQHRRGLFVLAGYLHETIMLIRSVGDRHITMEAFVPLRDIAYSEEYKKARSYFKIIRNYTAFHLDSADFHEVTRESLAQLDATMYVLMGGDDDTAGTFYFEFSDYLDFAYVGKSFQGDRTAEETANDIQKTIIDTALATLNAAFAFQVSLAKKMELQEYVYK